MILKSDMLRSSSGRVARGDFVRHVVLESERVPDIFFEELFQDSFYEYRRKKDCQ